MQQNFTFKYDYTEKNFITVNTTKKVYKVQDSSMLSIKLLV
jgi:hypothetical protein